jgi:hypothetical protein
MQSRFVHTSFDVGHQVAGSLVRGAVYHAEGRRFSHMSTPMLVIVAIGIVAAVWLWQKRP